MKQLILVLAVALFACNDQVGQVGSGNSSDPITSLDNRFDSLSYAIGVSFGGNMKQGGMDQQHKPHEPYSLPVFTHRLHFLSYPHRWFDELSI